MVAASQGRARTVLGLAAMTALGALNPAFAGSPDHRPPVAAARETGRGAATLAQPADDSLLPERVRAAGSKAKYAAKRGDMTVFKVKLPDGQVRRVRAWIDPVDANVDAMEQGVVARIRADGDYLKLGINEGTNYVWVDFVGGRRRELIVPARTNKRAFWLRTPAPPPHDHTRDPRWARFVRIGDDDGTCKRCPKEGWCTGSDTSRVYAVRAGGHSGPAPR